LDDAAKIFMMRIVAAERGATTERGIDGAVGVTSILSERGSKPADMRSVRQACSHIASSRGEELLVEGEVCFLPFFFP